MLEQENQRYQDYVSGLPPYLAAFAEPQHYDLYTPEDQAIWRFIMRQLVQFFKTKAPDTYERGLQRAAIPVERIPRIEEMIDSLKEIGWGAICVNGFIPPAAFMEYNAHKILPISADMRSLKHLLYTPAPDIVHEAAGHAPIVADPEYTDFLQKVGEYGAKALSNKYDTRVYETIRKLSIVKECPHSTEQEIQVAKKELDEAVIEQSRHPQSEASLISRFHWWTVEYGLLKRPEGMRMYGAGLLSSLGEVRNCLGDQVKKIKLSIDCVKTNYDITTEQPQLFYVESSKDLFPVLEELANRMAFRMGGAISLERAIQSQCIATVVYDSGIQISGVWNRCLKDKDAQAFYIGTGSPSSLAYQNEELEGHGEEYHTHGFSSPLGRLKKLDHPLAQLDYSELEQRGIIRGQKSYLEFESGVLVEGKLEAIMSRHGLNILMTFTDCRVKGPQGEVLFQPEWGTYDMAVGDSITSVFGGPADKRNYNFIQQKSNYRNLDADCTEIEKKTFALYAGIRQMREEEEFCHDKILHFYEKAKELAPNNWLIHIELMELLKKHRSPRTSPLEQEVAQDLEHLKGQGPEIKNLIHLGLELCAADDKCSQ